MQQLELVIHNATGLHARPARVFVELAKQYKSSINIHYGGKKANAKSLISVLTLGVPNGQLIQVDVHGEDEETAAAAIAAAVSDGLGEGPTHTAEPHTAEQPVPASAHATAAHAIAGNLIHGIAGAAGIVIGPVFQFQRVQLDINEQFVDVAHEQSRLQHAIEAARQQLETLHHEVAQRTQASEAEIFKVHHEILEDPALMERVRTAIAAGQSAAQAWRDATTEQAKELSELSNALLAERASDIRDVSDRVLRLLTGITAQAAHLPEHPVIVVASDLTPSETVALDPQRVLGFCTAVGGPNAHTAILASALGIPAIVSAGASVLQLASGTMVILDGDTGLLTVDPDEAALWQAQQQQQRQYELREAAAKQAADLAYTADQHRIEVVGNIGGLHDATDALTHGAEGIGLFRTEVLFLDRTTAPDEEEQFRVYRDIAKAFGSHPVIIRTLDIGGDKEVPYLALPHEENPFLGVRGVRLCLAHPELFRTQLRAILRAASYGNLRIMFPMIADLGELRAARVMVESIRAELGVPAVQIGIMIEVPSAALMADILAPEVDFFSIGTNDLCQYTLAMDRMHPTLAGQADDLHPAVLRLIAQTTEAARAAGRWVGVCGKLAANPVAIPILIGLGVAELSVATRSIPLVKVQIRTLTLSQCQERARQALQCATAADVRAGAQHDDH